MIKINLNPEKEKEGISFQFFLSEIWFSNYIYAGIFVASIVGVGVYNFLLSSAINDLEKQKKQLSKEKQKYQKVANKIKQLNREIANLNKTLKSLEDKKLVYENIPSERKLFLNMFSAISVSLPDGVWLSKIKLSRKSSTFEGFSFKPEYVSYFYEKINKHYSSVDFSYIKKESNKINEYYIFKFSLSNFKISREKGQKWILKK